jgi:hypothetical protein
MTTIKALNNDLVITPTFSSVFNGFVLLIFQHKFNQLSSYFSSNFVCSVLICLHSGIESERFTDELLGRTRREREGALGLSGVFEGVFTTALPRASPVRT